MSLLVQIAAEFTGKKAFKDADKGIDNLTKSAKKLAGALGVALSVKAVADFSKASIKAFSEDQAAAAKLAKVVDNLGLAFANPEISKFIDDLSKASGVTDDRLRPAFQSLITTTGSLVQSQKLLAQAIDVSAGSGVDLATVSQDLANAYVGNTKGLKKYNLGLTQAELKSASFLQIQEKLNEQFSGSNAAYLETYAGKMQLLSTAAGEAQEKIGGALVNALEDVFGAADITELIGKIDILSSKVANMIDTIAWKWKKFWFATSDKAILSQLNPFSNYVSDGLAKIDADHAADLWKTAMEKATGFGPDSRSPAGANSAKLTAAEIAAKKRAQEIAKAQQKQLKATKEQTLLKKQQGLFDIQQIQLIAALQGKLSDEDRKRAELQLALLTGNADEATRLTKEIANSIDKTGNLAKFLTTLPDANNPFKNWDMYLATVQDRLRIIQAGGGANVSTFTSTDTSGLGAATTATINQTDDATLAALQAADEAQKVIDSINASMNSGVLANLPAITVNFAGSDSLSNALRDSFVSASMQGSFSQINRSVGAFDR